MILHNNILIGIYFLTMINCVLFTEVRAELYTSVDGLLEFGRMKEQIIKLLNESIKAENNRLRRLYTLIEVLDDSPTEDPLGRSEKGSKDLKHASDKNLEKTLTSPVGVFVKLNQIIRSLEELEMVFGFRGESTDEFQIIKSQFQFIKEKLDIPFDDNLAASGLALLRLQKFYGLNIDDIVHGDLIGKSDQRTLVMSHPDCIELGKIAYYHDEFRISIGWMHKALELLALLFTEGNIQIHNEDEMNLISWIGKEFDDEVSEILEYMAFAAYKTGQILYSTKLTKLWLKIDPNNDRALGNLEYYFEALKEQSLAEFNQLHDFETGNLTAAPSATDTLSQSSDRYAIGKPFTSFDYVYAEDEIVRNLCLSKTPNNQIYNSVPSKVACLRRMQINHYLSNPEIKIETLSTSPQVIRVHEILSKREADHLRRLAQSRLKRSTVQTRWGLVESDFRIAKTAWLSGKRDEVVKLIEKRLSAIFGMNMEESEDLQVVNYGVGGFYGPHLDSARQIENEVNQWRIGSFASNDRMATILIYLNHVDAGGSTVFPKLNLTVEPLARSAVFWYNLKRNGFSDDRTLHTGCPVLLGSKWIATKWPREVDNTFLRPCALSEQASE